MSAPSRVAIFKSRRLWMRVLLILTIGGMGIFTILVGEIQRASTIDETQPADAILVLGAGVQEKGKPSGALAARVRHAADLYRRGYAPFIALTGGQLPGRPASEESIARAMLIEWGIPEAAIVGEGFSQTTAQNAAYITPCLHTLHIRRVLLVTSPFHMWRGRWIIEEAGFVVYPSPAWADPAESRPLQRAWYVTREAGAFILHLLFGL